MHGQLCKNWGKTRAVAKTVILRYIVTCTRIRAKTFEIIYSYMYNTQARLDIIIRLKHVDSILNLTVLYMR